MSVGIKIENLSKSFGRVLAVDGISMQFAEGRLHGLIGSDGAGKTTLMRLVLSLLDADAGSCSFTEEGREVALREIRDAISYMPARPSLYPDLSVDEHLSFFKDIYMIGEEEFAENRERLLSITRLDKFLDRKAGELSGGMYKKLGLMCALLQRPKALLLDEPTNGVDPISRREFWELLYSLAAEKILIVIATAYMDEAERCHEVHLLDRGRMLATGEPRALLAEAGVRSFDEYYLKRAES
ncbi:MAG TPA: ABC transporter ATP-binding protein [bacterium]|nr:ABC transporter ATP-binding protein [bacterium]